MEKKIQAQLNRIENNQKIILERMKSITALSEILLDTLASRPELLAKVETLKGTAGKPVVPRKRGLSKKERMENIKAEFSKKSMRS